MRKSTLTCRVFLVLLFVITAFAGCRKKDDGSDLPDNTSQTISGNMITTISGQVVDESGNPLNGATVTCGTVTEMTDQYGVFVLNNVHVDSKRAIVSAVKAGYWDQQIAFIPQKDETSYTKLTLFSDVQLYTVNGATGGTLTLPQGSTVTFNADAFVDAGNNNPYTGTVHISAHELLTDDPDFSRKVPGGDMHAKATDGTDVLLVSYGMFGFRAYSSSGRPLQLAGRAGATLTLRVGNNMTAQAPQTIPMWTFNPSQSGWVQSSVMGVLNTSVIPSYTAPLTSTGWTNCDQSSPPDLCTVKGVVKDCNGNPLVNATVSSLYGSANTSSNGTYQLTAPANITFTMDIYYGTVMQSITAGPFATNSTSTVPDIILYTSNCSRIVSGHVYNCSGGSEPTLVTFASNGILEGFQVIRNGSYSMSLPVGPVMIMAKSLVTTFHGAAYANAPINQVPFTASDITLCQSGALNTIHFDYTSNGILQSVDYNIYKCKIINVTPTVRFCEIYYNLPNGTNAALSVEIPLITPGTKSWDNGSYIGPFGSSTNNDGFTDVGATPSSGGVFEGNFQGTVIELGNTGYVMAHFKATLE